MGHRIQFVHRMLHGREPFPAWKNYPQLFRNGFYTFLGMLFYNIPSGLCLLIASLTESRILLVAGILLFVLAMLAIPGYMSHFCVNFDVSEIFNPLKALRRSIEMKKDYLDAWGIAFCALVVSFGGLLLGGIGFLFTSVWFWQVAGFSFATAFTKNYRLESGKIFSDK